MTNIIEAIKEEKIEELKTILPNIKLSPEHLFLAISLTKPKATKIIFDFCNHTFTNATNEYGDTLLKTAIYSYHTSKPKNKNKALEIVELTILNSDNINTKDLHNNTAVLTSSFLNLPEVTSLLLKHNANYTITDHTENNALDKALWEEHQEVVLSFFSHNSSLKNSATLYKGQTPLTKMIYGQKVAMVKFLLDQQVDITASTEDGTLPLDIARELKNAEIIGLLENHQQSNE
jgi:ankyrin repeat protein